MAQVPDPDPERHGPDVPIPPEDRLWRHPSELAAGVSPPSAWFPAPAPPTRRHPAYGALAGACLAGALAAFGAMWLIGPTRANAPRAASTTSAASASASATTLAATFAPSRIPTRELADSFGPTLPTVQVERDGAWTSGTGVWLDASGTLFTAAPLIAGATQIVVTGTDGLRQLATVAGVDPATAVATLKVAHTSGAAIAADPTPARASEPIVLAASPGALAGGPDAHASLVTTVPRIVSVRTAVGGFVLHDGIQLDRAVPADAIGGLLLDEHGRLVGLALGNGDNSDLGAATPAGPALAAARALRDNGHVSRAWLGVQATDLDPTRATLLQLRGGALLTSVTPGSPAAEAGIQAGDVITQVADLDVDDASDLVVALRSMHPGEQVTIGFTRDGEPTTRTVTLG